MRSLLAISLSTGMLTTGCFGVVSHGNGMYYGGGGIGLFLIILIAGLVLGKKH